MPKKSIILQFVTAVPSESRLQKDSKIGSKLARQCNLFTFFYQPRARLTTVLFCESHPILNGAKITPGEQAGEKFWRSMVWLSKNACLDLCSGVQSGAKGAPAPGIHSRGASKE